MLHRMYESLPEGVQVTGVVVAVTSVMLGLRLLIGL